MIRAVGLVLVIVLLGACSPGLVTTPVRPDELDFPDLQLTFPEVTHHRLNNGMQLYLREDNELPLVEMTLLVAGGSIRDPLDKTGLSQLFAAALITGGAGPYSPEALEMELEARAIELHSESLTYAYRINLSFHSQDLPWVVDVLSELLRNPRFEGDRVAVARQQLHEDVRRRNDDPGAIAQRLLAETVVPQHPLGASATLKNVEALTRDDLLEIHRTFFRPGNVWFAVSGDITEKALLHLLEERFGRWTAPSSAVESFPPLPAPPDGKVLVVDKDLPQTTILMGHAGVAKDNPDNFALRVANYILGGGGFNSRMMREVRSNRGLAYSVYSYFRIGRYLPELFIAGSETKCRSTPEVVSVMRSLMEEMIEEPVSTAELEQAKQSLINSFVFAFENTHSVVTREMRLDFYDYPEGYMESYRQRISEVSAEDVQRVARTYLRPEQLQIVLVGDSELFVDQLDELDLPIEEVQL